MRSNFDAAKILVLTSLVAIGLSACIALPPVASVPSANPESRQPHIDSEPVEVIDPAAEEDESACRQFRTAMGTYSQGSRTAGEDLSIWSELLAELGRDSALAAAEASNGREVESSLTRFASASLAYSTAYDENASISVSMEVEWEASMRYVTDACGMRAYTLDETP